MGFMLSAILAMAGFARAVVFSVPLAETIAITTSLLSIVFISVLIGATLPLGMKFVGIDPAHSSTVSACCVRLERYCSPSLLQTDNVVLSTFSFFCRQFKS